ncbi:putative multi-domain containing protein [Aduncisulcus paluster]|uniref:Proteasome subunit alpha type n=1 Tax=Aduncisulcus paluster TaxID=2918883 RepID=A0ABQ5JX62_9EUKA|nr:putative multi-domain containing protein [Aduncisulcus paluster]|eukprot:gnl/Carplike_NY0171/537_a737_2324.p1 GENE.gnl/Carplike_NY0171/537_a737_2324~~gnl/Carplike_NY0171/537_a737_2324.p1  ORF type:complete len:299 (+),score=71.14 gnl/Carplike_NY0171/537_a737_2324:22-918(+)
MFLSRSDYDRGVNTFSPEGRILQVEYAIEAIKIGATAIGIQVEDGVVLAVEKRISSKLEETKIDDKIVEIDYHLFCTFSGLSADARTLVDHGRVAAQDHRFLYDEPVPPRSLTQSISDQALLFGEEGAKRRLARPYGVALLIGGYDDKKGFVLFHNDPSGTFCQTCARAIGRGGDTAQQMLTDSLKGRLGRGVATDEEDSEDDDLRGTRFRVPPGPVTLETATKLTVYVLKRVMEEKISKDNISLCILRKKTADEHKDAKVCESTGERVTFMKSDSVIIERFDAEKIQAIIDSLEHGE